MNKITRYNPCMSTSGFGFNRAAMQPETHGLYVTHAEHQSKMNALQSRLRALESMQKQDFFYHLQKGLGLDKIAEQAIESAVNELVKKATQTIFKVDPCQDLTKEMVDDLVKRMGEGAFATGGMVMESFEPCGGFVKIANGKMHMSDAYLKSGVISASELDSKTVNVMNAVSDNPANTASKYKLNVGVKIADPKAAVKLSGETEPCGLMCVKSDVDYFTAGERYSYGYEIQGGVKKWFVSGDNYVSDLAVEDRWTLEDGGAYMYVKNEITGQYSAVFKKP